MLRIGKNVFNCRYIKKIMLDENGYKMTISNTESAGCSFRSLDDEFLYKKGTKEFDYIESFIYSHPQIDKNTLKIYK